MCFVTDNPPTLPGVDDNSVYVGTTNYQYYDDAEEFLYSEVLSHYGDLLVSLIAFFRSSRTHLNFVSQAREIEIFCEDCKLAAPLGFFSGASGLDFVSICHVMLPGWLSTFCGFFELVFDADCIRQMQAQCRLE